ncbi:MAG: hypothetical protein SFW67_21185 [Myxococcaceae bacterium]|nr:hypothetical protein [Myxococcaceae bacterium]
MRVSTTCARRRAPLETETAYVGAPRGCPSCHATFVLECPRDVPAALKQARKPAPPARRDLAPELPELACARCTSGFRQRTPPGAGAVTCPSCGAQQPVVEASRLVTTLAAVEPEIWTCLLRGDPVQVAARVVESRGLSRDAAELLVRARVPLLPFVRASTQVDAFEPGGSAPLTSPLHCEGCRSPLLGRWRLVFATFATRRQQMTPVTQAPGAASLEAALRGADARGLLPLHRLRGLTGPGVRTFPRARPLHDARVEATRVVASRLQGQITWTGPTPTPEGSEHTAPPLQPP